MRNVPNHHSARYPHHFGDDVHKLKGLFHAVPPTRLAPRIEVGLIEPLNDVSDRKLRFVRPLQCICEVCRLVHYEPFESGSKGLPLTIWPAKFLYPRFEPLE